MSRFPMNLRGAVYGVFIRHRGRMAPHIFTARIPETDTNVLVTRTDVGAMLHNESYNSNTDKVNRAYFEEKIADVLVVKKHIENGTDLLLNRYKQIFVRMAKMDDQWQHTPEGIVQFFARMRERVLETRYYVDYTLKHLEMHQEAYEMELKYTRALDELDRREAARKRMVKLLNTGLDRVEKIKQNADYPRCLADHVKHYSVSSFGYYYTMVDMLDMSLYDYMLPFNTRPRSNVHTVSKMLLQAVAYCHTNGMFCLDIDARTIGVKVEADGTVSRVVLGDVYDAKHVRELVDTVDTNYDVGSVSYRSIELLLRSIVMCVRTLLLEDNVELPPICTDEALMDQTITHAVDSWACGVLIMQLLCSRTASLLSYMPFDSIHPASVLRQVFELFGMALEWEEGDRVIAQINDVSFGMIPEYVHPQPMFYGNAMPSELDGLVSVMRGLMIYNPKNRLSVSDALARIQ